MNVLLWVWALAAAAVVGVAMGAGWAATHQFSGILIDARGRYSLTRLQVALWTLVVVSQLVGVGAARATVAGLNPFDFSIPDSVLAAIGVSLASGVGAITIKTYKDRIRGDYVSASVTKAEAGEGPAARVAQIVLVEEGPLADQTVDITKFQNLLFTVFFVAAYVVITVNAFREYGPSAPIQNPSDITTLPEFNTTFVALLVISHAGYLGGKLPNRGGTPWTSPQGIDGSGTPAFSVTDRNLTLAARRTTRRPATGLNSVSTRSATARNDPATPNGDGGVNDLHRPTTLLEAEVAELRAASAADSGQPNVTGHLSI